MFNKKCGLVLLTLLLLLVSVSGVCATDNNTDFDNNCLSDVHSGNVTNLDQNISTVKDNNYNFYCFPTKCLRSHYNIYDWSTFDYNVDNFLTLDKELLKSYHISSFCHDSRLYASAMNSIIYITAPNLTLENGTYSNYSVYVHDFWGNPINEEDLHPPGENWGNLKNKTVVYVNYNENISDHTGRLMYGYVIDGKADICVYAPSDGVGVYKATISYVCPRNMTDYYNYNGYYLRCNTTAYINVVKN